MKNSVPHNQNATNSPNNDSRPLRPVLPPPNPDYNTTELIAPEGSYPLLHEQFKDFFSVQWYLGSRVSLVSLRDDYHGLESSDDEGLFIGGMNSASFSMTPVKSAALPIPNKSAAKSTIRTTTAASSIGNSIRAGNGLQILTSPQKLMTTTASGNNSSPYFPSSPLDPSTPTQQQQHQFASGSYMMSSSQDLHQADYGFPSSYNNNNNAISHSVAGSVSSLSSLFGRNINPTTTTTTTSRSTSQLSASIAKSMASSSNNNSKPKNNLARSNSAFVTNFLVHENLQKILASNTENNFLFYNIAHSFIWLDATHKTEDWLSRISFSNAFPSCHHINETTRCEDHIDIVIGFTTGDLVWYEPLSCKYVRLNKAGCMVNSPVVSVKWVHGSEDLFIVVFKNGTAMVMDKERDDQGFSVPEPSTNVEAEFMSFRPHRSSKYNPISFWRVGDKPLSSLCFSPDGIHMAITGDDRKLRIIDYRNERLTDVFSAYYGRLRCVDWSPDGKYIVTGGEDDLVTIWSFSEKRMIARCIGHDAFVTDVSFDRWKCDGENYRICSVGEDCNLIFWDFSLSALQKPKHQRVPAAFKLHEPAMLADPTPLTTTFVPVTPINIERKKSLKNSRLFKGFSSPDAAMVMSSSTNSSIISGSFSSRFRKWPSSSSRSQQEYADDIVEEQMKQLLPVLHPPVRYAQAATLQPTAVVVAHADPIVSVAIGENTIVTADRRGRVLTWGRP